ncbi:MAG: PD-(D/E)XK nuclease family protein [Elusimicrobia bacterium]|nr:PD-(D/E)XK nuclease family protein [Elusimicrobiota bacterium]
MFEISYTKVRAYLNCPWLYKLKFIDDWKAPPSPEASLGLSVHKALELYHQRAASGGEAAMAALDEVWDRAGYRNAEEELAFYDRARELLERYLRDIAASWPGRVKEIEKNFELTLPESNLKLIGIMDRIDQMPDGSFALIEYKTHAAPWAETRLADDLQMTIYSRAAEQALGLSPLKLFFFFVSQGRAVEVSRGKQQWLEARRALEDVALKVKQGFFDPDRRYCPYCEMKRSCAYSTERSKT